MPTSPRRKAPPGTPSVPGIIILDAFYIFFVSVFLDCLCLCKCLCLSSWSFQAVYNPDSFHFHSVRKHSAFLTCSYSLISFLTRSSSSSCFFWAAQSKSPQDESFCHHRNNSPWWRTGWCCNWTFAHHFHRLPGPQSWSWFSCSGCGDVRQNLLFFSVVIMVIMWWSLCRWCW